MAITTQAPPKIWAGFAEENFFIEFHGGFTPNAPWYRPFWVRLRQELNSADPEDISCWIKGGGFGYRWSLPLVGEHLNYTLSREDAWAALERTVSAFNTFPHNVGITVIKS